MKPGQASVTAQRAAAYRLTFDRVTARYGNPPPTMRWPGTSPRRRAHDRVRCASTCGRAPGFFDGVVTRALGGGCTQVVTGAAGYGGRSLRYERPGTLWFEVDHPATQRDKRARLGRLGIHSGQVSFVAADFTTDPVADLLLAAGLDPCMPSLFLLEGVAAYAEEAVLTSLLAQLRRIAADGSTLAISLPAASGTPERAARRAAFQAAVAAVGEPARSILEPADASALLEAAGWRPARQPGTGSKAAHAGFIVAEPAGVLPA